MTIQDIRAKIIPTLRSQGVLKAALFGSVVRGEAKKSDVDILSILVRERAYWI